MNETRRSDDLYSLVNRINKIQVHVNLQNDEMNSFKKLIENNNTDNKKILEQVESIKDQEKREHLKMSDKIFQTNKEVNKKVLDSNSVLCDLNLSISEIKTQMNNWKDLLNQATQFNEDLNNRILKIEKKPEKTYDKEILELNKKLNFHENDVVQKDKKIEETFKSQEIVLMQFLHNQLTSRIIKIFKRYDHKLKNDLMIDEEELNDKDIYDLLQEDMISGTSNFSSLNNNSENKNNIMGKRATEDKNKNIEKNLKMKVSKEETSELNKYSNMKVENNNLKNENVGSKQKNNIDQKKLDENISGDSNSAEAKIKLKNYEYANQSESNIKKISMEKKTDLKITLKEGNTEIPKKIENIIGQKDSKSIGMPSNKMKLLINQNFNENIEQEENQKSIMKKIYEEKIEKAKQIIEDYLDCENKKKMKAIILLILKVIIPLDYSSNSNVQNFIRKSFDEIIIQIDQKYSKQIEEIKDSYLKTYDILSGKINSMESIIKKNDVIIRFNDDKLKEDFENRKKFKSDVMFSLNCMKESIQDAKEIVEYSKNSINTINEVIKCLINDIRIQHILELQEEHDKETISLVGIKDIPDIYNNSRKGGLKPMVSLNKKCLSCSGEPSLIINAFKIACLLYKPTPVRWKEKYFSRTCIIHLRARVIQNLIDQNVLLHGLSGIDILENPEKFSENSNFINDSLLNSVEFNKKISANPSTPSRSLVSIEFDKFEKKREFLNSAARKKAKPKPKSISISTPNNQEIKYSFTSKYGLKDVENKFNNIKL